MNSEQITDRVCTHYILVHTLGRVKVRTNTEYI